MMADKCILVDPDERRLEVWRQVEAVAVVHEAVLAKLSEMIFIEAVRRYGESLPDGGTGWLAGLQDRYVARAIREMAGKT